MDTKLIFHRRTMFGWAARAAAGTITGAALTQRRAKADAASDRLQSCYDMRVKAAGEARDAGMSKLAVNGDETRYRDRSGNFSKGLPHNSRGDVDSSAYNALASALLTGNSRDFETVAMGGTAKLVNPQAGLAFDMEGRDSHQFAIGTPPALASAERAAEAVELYWMALLRDVNFTDYGTDPLVQSAAAELSRLSAFRGPRDGAAVTPGTLFRGSTPGDLAGPYVSQFLLQPFEYGSLHIDQTINTYVPGVDFMTDPAAWLAVQNGQGPFPPNKFDSARRYIRNGRDLTAYVHIDQAYQAYLNASLWLSDHKAPFNPSNPYRTSRNQSGFATFGAPAVQALMAEATSRALKAVWYQKWFVHRALRPEEYGGRVHFTKSGGATYDVHADVLRSEAVDRVTAKTGSSLLPQAYPEAAPLHPSYGSGHATVAGACCAILKAFYDSSTPLSSIADVVEPAPTGLALLRYAGPDRDRLTVGGEIDKLASNMATGRNMAGIHWRSDFVDGARLGEAVAIDLLREHSITYNESFRGFAFTAFDGSAVSI